MQPMNAHGNPGSLRRQQTGEWPVAGRGTYLPGFHSWSGLTCYEIGVRAIAGIEARLCAALVYADADTDGPADKRTEQPQRYSQGAQRNDDADERPGSSTYSCADRAANPTGNQNADPL